MNFSSILHSFISFQSSDNNPIEEMHALFVFVAVALGLAEAAKFPKEWKNCKHDENLNGCLKDALQNVIPFLVQGVPNLGVLSIDPLHFEILTIGRAQNHPVSLDLEFRDVNFTGIKEAIVKSVETDWKTMKVEMEIPKLKLNAKYKVEGKVLVLPIQGDGDCELEFDNFRGHLTSTYGEKVTGSKKYYNMENLEFLIDADLMKLRFDNLFNGDKALGNQMNIFLNENWKELLKELGPPFAKSLAMAFAEIGNRVFTKIPKDEITPP